MIIKLEHKHDHGHVKYLNEIPNYLLKIHIVFVFTLFTIYHLTNPTK